jgi:hypothetical protein
MSEKPQDQNGRSKAAADSSGRKTLRFLLGALLVVMTVIAIVTEIGELASMLKPGAIANQSMFSIPSEITLRFTSCNYNFLFFCEQKPGVENCEQKIRDEAEQEVCIATVTSPSFNAAAVPTPKWQTIPYVNVVLYSFVMLPRLPDSIIHMLKKRWGHGPMEFWLGVFFVLAYIALVVVVLKGKSPMKFWYFVLAIVFGPYLVIGVFWILQHALLGASAGAQAVTAFILGIFGPPLCTAACLGHDLDMVAHVFKRMRKRA